MGYPGAQKLYDAARRQGLNVHRRDVETFVRSVASRQVFAPRQKHDGKIVSDDVDGRWAADLIDYSKRPSKRTDGRPYMYVLLVQDIFTRKLFAHALVDKSPQTTSEAFASIVRSNGEAPKRLDTDQGEEFKGAFAAYLAEENIYHVRKDVRDLNALGTLDAAIRNIKEQLARIMASENVRSWHTILARAIEAFNKSTHSSLHGHAPDEVEDDRTLRFFLRGKAAEGLAKNDSIIQKRADRLERLEGFRDELVPEKHMKRGNEPRWSDEVRRVGRVEGGTVVTPDGQSFPTRHVLAVPADTAPISTEGLRGGAEADKRREELEPFLPQLRAIIAAPMALTRAAAEMDKIPALKALMTRGMTHRRALDLLGFETTNRMVGPKQAEGAAPLGNFQAEQTRRQRAALEPYRARIAAAITERTSLKVAAQRMKTLGLTLELLKAQRLGNYARVLGVLGYRVEQSHVSPPYCWAASAA